MSEQVRASGPMYRPSRDDDVSLDAGMRRILYVMGAGGLVLLVGAAIYGLAGHSRGGVVPVVQADSAPLRVKPADPGGMAVASQAKPVDPNDSHLAPPTEEPNPRALLALTSPNGKQLASAPLIMPPPRPKPVLVQLSEAKTEAAAQQAWEHLAKRMPELFSQHRALYLKINERGAAPWRLRTAGFADPAQAKSFCDKLKSKGASCSVVES